MSLGDENTVFEDVGMFEAAVHAQAVELESPELKRLVLSLDGSNQDETAKLFAAQLSSTAGAEVFEQTGAQNAREILEFAAQKQAQLLIVPVPFGQDIDELQNESLGSVVDVLMLESACPVFCVRQPMAAEAVAQALSDAIVPVNVNEASTPRAAAWSFRFVKSGGRIELLAVPDRDVIEEARKLLGSAIDPLALQREALDRAVTHDIAGLIAAVQKRGAEEGFNVHVELQLGRPVQVVLERANKGPHLIVVGTPKDHTTLAFHRALDLILGAVGPVVVV
ncbi:MAG: hypothetical protein KatS3mg105_3810 [Gemmatales bacterium]|nr:MAG: hypothetical protein KatS3mg105_3810 [Gemmatales bacterium]